jgi:hypothetical protein
MVSNPLPEATMKTIWPSIGAKAPGRIVGLMAGFTPPGDRFRILGRLGAAVSIPLALCVYAWMRMPGVIRRYRITNHRLLVLAGLSMRVKTELNLDAFDSIRIEVLSGQAWLNAGDLVFSSQGQDLLRLPGVGRPEVFRMACLKAQAALVAVDRVLQEQQAAASANL